MFSKITNYIKQCRPCVPNAPQATVRPEPMIITHPIDKNWQLVSIDFWCGGGKTFLVLVDERSKYPIINLSGRLTSTSAINILEKVFKEFCVPEVVKSDNGRAFTSQEFIEFANKMGFKRQLVMSYWPNANGDVESKMKIINKA